MAFGENFISPYEIEDARAAAHQASENQRAVEDRMRKHSGELAEAEKLYRKALSKRILALRAGTEDEPPLPATVCDDVARGEDRIAELRYKRDIAAGIFEATKQEAFSRGADRRDIDTLLNWSMKRDLRVDAEPAEYPRPIGAAA